MKLKPYERLAIPVQIALFGLMALLVYMQIGSINLGHIMINGDVSAAEFERYQTLSATLRTGYHTAVVPHIEPVISAGLEPTATPDPNQQSYRPLIYRPLKKGFVVIPKPLPGWLAIRRLNPEWLP